MKWGKVKLGNIATVDWGNTDLTKSAYIENGKYPAVSAAGVDGRINHFEHSEDTIVISAIGANCGVVFYPGERFTAIKNTLTVSPNPKLVLGKYLFWFFTTNVFRRRGAGQPFLSKNDTELVEIPLPPLPIQKRIAEILDAADALRKKDQELLKKYDDLAQAIFIDMFGDPVKNEKGWEIGTIRDIVAEVKYGTSKPADPNGSIPYLRMNNITYGGEWDLKDLKFINLDEDEYEKYIIKNGDLVFNRTNSKELVGKTAVYNFDNEVAIAGYLIRVRANDKGNPYYISGYLNSKHGKKTLEGMCKSIVGMANINAQELQNIQILIPPIKVQQKYASLYDHVSNLKNRLKSQIFESGKLFQNTLQKAFSGELVS